MPFSSKQDYVNRLFEILNPLLTHYTDDNTRLVLGYTGASYPPDLANTEAFLRVMWGLAPYLAGGGSSEEFENIYLQGLSVGPNPDSPHFWGEGSDNGQILVEMTAIAVGLLLAPDKLWEPLPQEAKENLTAWLGTINQFELRPSNWLFFGILVNVALLKLGSPYYNEEHMRELISSINEYYKGNGWYSDGIYATYDYYVAFALHFYGLIYAHFMENEDPETSRTFKERAELFGRQFVYWFDSTGAGVAYGRSLTYRFAQVAFYSACVFAGVEPLTMGQMKGIIDRNLDWWWQSHMRDFSGILTIGYSYPDLIMAETYNAPGSPLWALKSFLLLALSDDHPYWTAEPAAFPQLSPIVTMPQPQMIVTNNGNNSTLYPGGYYYMPLTIGHAEEKYAKFAYSTKYGFSVRKANDCLENMAPDSDLVFEIGGLFFGRNIADTVEMGDNTITTTWSPFPGIEVTTTITPSEFGHSRQHTIVSSIQCTAYDCGFSLPLSYANYSDEVSETSAHLQNDYGACTVYIYNPPGSGYQTQGMIVRTSANTNLLFPRVSIPVVRHSVNVGTTSFLTSVIVGTRV